MWGCCVLFGVVVSGEFIEYFCMYQFMLVFWGCFVYVMQIVVVYDCWQVWQQVLLVVFVDDGQVMVDLFGQFVCGFLCEGEVEDFVLVYVFVGDELYDLF